MDNMKDQKIYIKPEDKKIFELYTLAELAYQKHFENRVSDKTYLYPEDWYRNKNYKQKIEIISQAIKENVLIEETIMYKNSIEGINVLVK